MAPGKYRIRRRLEFSCQLLNMPHLGVAEIAEQLGYASLFDFSKQFKKYMGMSPTAYRLSDQPVEGIFASSL